MKKTYIQHITISNLWGQYQINWELDPQVNILVGGNGSGKTTILNILYAILGNKDFDYPLNPEAIVQITYNEGRKFRFWAANMQKYASVEVGENGEWLSDLSLDDGNLFHQLCPVQKIQTFDSKEKIIAVADQSYLYHLLETAIYGDGSEENDSFLKFQNRTLMRQNELLKKGKIKEASLADQNIEKFYTIINDFFAITGKKIVFENQKLFFIRGGNKITLSQLSSGEKQLLIIFFNVLFQDNQACVLLMDEPEISLDIDWQAILIDKIVDLNPNCQLIVATHSPSIFGEGWGDKVIFMEDICKIVGQE